MNKAHPDALTNSDEINALTDPNFMTSLARGLAVVRAFAASCKPQTIAQLSRRTGIPRGSVMRCLHTLKQLGYVDMELNNYTLRPKILTFGQAYLSSTPLTLSAQALLDQVSSILDESCSLAVLDDHEVLYLARSIVPRVMSVTLGAGARLPAYCTSLGRVLLAQLPEDELDRYLAHVPMGAHTEHTVTEPARLREILAIVRQKGYAINSEELELGLRSIAVPLYGESGRVQAALIVGAQAARVGEEQMIAEFLPVLREAAQELAYLLP
jgi:IclR family pca regulon transcriptional regulator